MIAKKGPKRRAISSRRRLRFSRWLAAPGGAVALAVMVYLPALHGAFVFDDRFLPYGDPARAMLPLRAWIGGVRPLLYLSFWINYQISGSETFGYHLVNVLLHAVNATLIFYIARRLLRFAHGAESLAWMAAGVFLLHPLETESVAYIASRSETLAAFFILSAWAVFVKHLPGVVKWRPAAAILLLFVAGCATKENAVVLLPVLLLSDYFWNTPAGWAGIRANWRVYLPMGMASAMAAVAAWRVLSGALTAGFHLAGITWHQYFLTECRVVFSYIRLFLFPVHQNIDYDVSVSRTAGLLGLAGLILLICAAIYFRRQYRLASYGVWLFLIFLAPTSSLVPFQDVMVEHRMYLAVFALTLVGLEFAGRLSYRRAVAALGIFLAVCGVLSWRRSHVWANAESLWQNTIAKSPDKVRPYSSLALYYMNQRRCGDAARLFDGAPDKVRRDYYFLILGGEAEGCLGQFTKAAGLLEKAASMRPEPHLFVQLGEMRASAGQRDEALEAFKRAIALNAGSEEAYMARGRWYEQGGEFERAAADYRQALGLNPSNHAARVLAEVMERRAARGHL